jgi:protein-L-isoaspartate O-methyltransferase
MSPHAKADARCPYCSGQALPRFRARDVNRRTSESEFSYFQCTSCSLIFVSPIPDNIGRYYPPEYYYIPSSLEELARGAEHERYKIDMIRQYAGSGRLLEIGPATGAFAYLAKQAGFKVETIEMDARCCKFLKEVLDIPAIETEDTISALKVARPFDVIAMWHVIEHLPDLWPTLDAIVDRLLPGGILVIAAPNPASFQFRFLRRYWAHVDAPRHVHLIPTRVLDEFMRRIGFETISTATNDEGCLGWNLFGWTYSLTNWTDSPFLKRRLHFVGTMIARALAPVERKNGLGSTYTMIFRKGAAP